MARKPQLTIIIPFLNEKNEVINTLKSIRDHSNSNDIEIILINDASNDGLDYEEISRIYNTQYVLNQKRLGVAASRDLGVFKSRTPYVMFLDAHMRFYNNLWVDRIINELKQDERVLLCCQSKGLTNIDGEIVEIQGRPLSFGTFINLYDEWNLLECNWIFKENSNMVHLETIPIPCVFGAAYSCSKKYWLHLKGLKGLKYYGNDEAYISIKVWLEGGKCKLLKDIIVGHIYRNVPPYVVESSYRLYNRMLIAELLFSERTRARMFAYFNNFFDCKEALQIFYKNRKMIYSLRKYYQNIFIYDFSYFESVNHSFSKLSNSTIDENGLLNDIAYHVILKCDLSSDDGILNGRFGIVIFLFHYSQYIKNEVYSQFAERILDDILNRISDSTPMSFDEGLLGIGWGMEYLYQNHFIQCDTNLLLEEIDEKILEIDLDKIECTLELKEIIHYVLSRLYTIEREHKHNPFTNKFLLELYQHITHILSNEKCDSEKDIFIRYCVYYEGLSEIHKPSIYDLLCLMMPQEYNYENFAIGLDGSAGVGLKLILDD